MKFYVHLRELKAAPTDIKDTFIYDTKETNVTLKEFLSNLGKVLPKVRKPLGLSFNSAF